MGFAVVADEVRNLAQRCAQAARETAAKIEDSIQKSGRGVQINERVEKSLLEIVTKVRHAAEIAAQALSGAREQSQGIEQVNIAISQMDKITQSNAANSEESASAAEELNAQAETLREAVDHLAVLVGSDSNPATRQQRGNAMIKLPPATPTQPAQVAAVKNGKPHLKLEHSTTVARPETGLRKSSPPPADGDFKNF